MRAPSICERCALHCRVDCDYLNALESRHVTQYVHSGQLANQHSLFSSYEPQASTHPNVSMRNAIAALSLLVTGTLAALDLHRATHPSLTSLDKRDICFVAPGPGACQRATTECGWDSGYILCNQDDDGSYDCYNPGLGETCCASGSKCLGEHTG